ncbi:MAG: relaxase/mobilization nuclease domain-containing protein [Leptolyngbyaceae cyanobacterium SM1_3_5]|nr:relaxase/mobilization nuclease domain-containing protein [Leptolyngbyaceae cyanobacterium SM1_3_5]
MIGKVFQNNNFRETTRYVLHKEKARILDGTVAGDNFDTISREFLMSHDLNPEIERPVYHLIQSYSYQDAEAQDLSDDFQRDRAVEHFAGLVVSAREPKLLLQNDKTEYKKKVKDFIELELCEYQWFCATHEDTKHKHTHFVASRINLIDGRCIPTWQDRERSQRICREIEHEQGLEPLQSSYEIERRSPTRRQKEEWEKTGIAPVMVQLQDAIDQEATPGRSIDQVLTALRERHDVEAKPKLNKGKCSIVFEKVSESGQLVRMSGSQIGRGYTYGAIERQLEREAQIEIDAPHLEPKAEAEPEISPLEQVLQEQIEYAQRLAPQIQTIWESERSGRPKLKTASFEKYQIRPSQDDQPELYRGDRKLLEYSEGTYRALGLTEQDCLAIERFNALSQEQAADRLRQSQTRQTEQERKKQRSVDQEL